MEQDTWTPPKDAVPVAKSTWKPPADAVPDGAKKASGNGGVNTSLPLPTGLSNIPTFQASTNEPSYQPAPIPKEYNSSDDKSLKYTTARGITSQIVSDRALEQNQNKKELVQHLKDAYTTALKPKVKEMYDSMTPENQDAFVKSAQFSPTRMDELQNFTPKDMEHWQFMNTTTPGKILGWTGTNIGQPIAKAGGDLVKGAEYLSSKLTNDPAAKLGQEFVDKQIDKATNLGLTDQDVQNTEGRDTYGLGKGVKTISSILPLVMGGEAAGAPKTVFFLQGLGQGSDTANQIEKETGKPLNPLAKDALIGGTGFVNSLFMGEFGSGVKAMSTGLRKKVVDRVTADAIKEVAGKNLTNEELTQHLTDAVKNWSLNFKKGGVNFLNKWLESAGTLSKMTLGNYGVKAATNALNGKDVMDTSGGTLIQDLGQAALKDAPFLGAMGALSQSKIAPHTEIKGDIEKAIFNDQSPEHIDQLKKQLYDTGFSDTHNWTPEQMDATFKHVDRIAEIAKTLPKDIPSDKIQSAMDLVQGRAESQNALSELQSQRSQLDPSLQETASSHEEYLNDKIEQANDKLRQLVTGKRTTYSKDEQPDKPTKYYKTTDGNREEITPSRYELENLERTSKQQNNENDKPNSETHQEENGIAGQQVEQRPVINSESEESGGQRLNEEPDAKDEEKGQVINAGEAKAEPAIKKEGEETNATTERVEPESGIEQHKNGNISGEATETGNSNSPERGGEIKQESEVSEPSKGENGEREVTGIRNADVEKERGEAVARTAKTKDEIEQEGKRLVDSEEVDPAELAKSIIDKPRPATAEEQAALLYHKTKLRNEQRKTEDPIEYTRLEDEIENNRKATEIIGNETGRTLGARTDQMAEDYSRVHILNKAKVANGGELSPKDAAELETRTKRIEELENKLADREEQIRKLHDANLLGKVHRTASFEERTAKREVTKTALRKQREELVADLHVIAKKSLGALGANKIPVDMIVPLTKLARNYVLDGALTIAQVTDKIYQDLKEHLPDVTKSDISDVIKDGFDSYVREQNQVRLDRAKKRQQTKLADLKEGNYEKKIVSKIQVDNDYIKIRADIAREQLLINKKIADLQNSQKSVTRKAIDFAVKYGRQAKLASVTVLGKLAATGLVTLGMKPITEGVGIGLSKVLPKIANKATYEGGGNLSSLAKSYAKAASLGMEDAWKELNISKGGKSDLSALYGKAGQLPAEAAEFFGHLHSAIKAPVKRAIWEQSYAKRFVKTAERGLDPLDPVIDAKNRLDAYKDGERAIFMGDNMISKAYEASMKTLENSTSSSAQNIAALTRILLPFVKVPTNIALSTGRYAFGLIPGLSKLGQVGAAELAKRAGAEGLAKLIHKGMGELTPEESEIVMRNLKHGSVGAAALAIGFFNPKNVGGYYQEHEHRKATDPNVDALKVFGVKIPSFLTEHPIFQAMQLGATFRRVMDAHRHKEDNISAAALATASGMAEHIPLANEAKQVTDLFGSDTKKGYRFISSLIKGEIEPAAIQQLATITDTKDKSALSLNTDNQQKRSPDKKHGLWKYIRQDLQMGIPGLRKNVPKKK